MISLIQIFRSSNNATTCSGCQDNSYPDDSKTGCLSCPDYSTGKKPLGANQCFCTLGFYQFYRTRAVGGLESLFYTTGSASSVADFNAFYGGEFYLSSMRMMRVHEFAYGEPVTLKVLKLSVMKIYCSESGTTYVLWDEGLRVFSGTGVCSASYPVTGDFGLMESTAYFKCQACAGGSISNMTGLEECFKCARGTFAAETNMTACKACSKGSITTGVGATTCISCSPGMFYTPGASSCKSCAYGKYSVSSGADNCSSCNASQWAPMGSTSCWNCPNGSTSPPGFAGAPTWCGCRAGYFMNQQTLVCEICEPGTYSEYNATSCTACSPGTYNAQPEAQWCYNCAEMTVAPLYGMTTCLQCDSGTFAYDGTVCSLCPLGYYCLPENGTMMQCPLGTYVTYGGLTSVDQCTPCPANGYCLNPVTFDYCPQYTSSQAGSTSKLDCVCQKGYTCVYSKAFTATVELPQSEEYFMAHMDEFIDAVAAAAHVSRDSVRIIGWSPNSVSKRALSGRRKKTVRVYVKGSDGLDMGILGRLTGITQASVHLRHQVQVRRV